MTLRAGVLVAFACVLAGCSGQHTSTGTPSPTLSRAGMPDVSAENPASAVTGQKATPTVENDDAVTVPVSFTSPSGNVACFISATDARCDILDRDWTPPSRPADCQFGYGQGITMSAGGVAEFVCAGDTTLGTGQPLPYGESVSAGALRCDSTESGITCRDTESGRGFALSREGYEIF
jgi:hypothetical protein